MNGTVIFGIIALFFIVTSLINFINDLQDEVDSPKNHNKSFYLKDKAYYDKNIFGEEIIVLDNLSERKKRELWNSSHLKNEMLKLFPNFTLMREFVENRIVDNGSFKKGLLAKIDTIEEQYVAGIFNGQRAKATLSSY